MFIAVLNGHTPRRSLPVIEICEIQLNAETGIEVDTFWQSFHWRQSWFCTWVNTQNVIEEWQKSTWEKSSNPELFFVPHITGKSLRKSVDFVRRIPPSFHLGTRFLTLLDDMSKTLFGAYWGLDIIWNFSIPVLIRVWHSKSIEGWFPALLSLYFTDISQQIILCLCVWNNVDEGQCHDTMSLLRVQHFVIMIHSALFQDLSLLNLASDMITW